jgi:hypothetical protein
MLVVLRVKDIPSGSPAGIFIYVHETLVDSLYARQGLEAQLPNSSSAASA